VKILLDTCTFIWLATEPNKVTPAAKKLFEDPDNNVFLSVVSCWEIAVKQAAGKLELPQPSSKLIPSYRERYGVGSLRLQEEAALYVPRLPKLHSDPFDRMLICQSIVHGLAILTPDELIAQYPVRTIW
jgi:PIN domain nuclease of toxin-antitoxin system